MDKWLHDLKKKKRKRQKLIVIVDAPGAAKLLFASISIYFAHYTFSSLIKGCLMYD